MGSDRLIKELTKELLKALCEKHNIKKKDILMHDGEYLLYYDLNGHILKVKQ